AKVRELERERDVLESERKSIWDEETKRKAAEAENTQLREALRELERPDCKNPGLLWQEREQARAQAELLRAECEKFKHERDGGWPYSDREKKWRATMASEARSYHEVEDRLRAECEGLQAAVDRAANVMHESAYVGGPSEREAWKEALLALERVATQHKGMNPVR